MSLSTVHFQPVTVIISHLTYHSLPVTLNKPLLKYHSSLGTLNICISFFWKSWKILKFEKMLLVTDWLTLTRPRGAFAPNKKSSYNQHRTIGLFRNMNLPHEVLKDQNGYKRNLAEEFLNVQLLTKVAAHLIEGNLEKWKLIFKSERGKNYNFSNLAGSEQKVHKFKCTSDVEREALDLLLELLLDYCYTLYEICCQQTI